MSFPYLGETKELNESTRAGAPGSFIALTEGVTHYEMVGEISRIPVVLVHGFSVPYFIFDVTFEFLCNSGYPVLRYDLFGRGFSDRPKVKYDIHVFVKQLADLLDALHLGRVDLLGLSMGAPITAGFIERCPDRVRKHILIDPAGARALSLPSLLMRVAKRPMAGRLAFGMFGSEGMIKSLAADLFEPALVREFEARYRVQMKYKGFKRAIFSTIRNGMLDSFYETYARVGKLKKPTLLFWGCDDTTVPFEHSRDILSAIPHAELHAIEDCGHLPHFEKPQIVNPALKTFLEAEE